MLRAARALEKSSVPYAVVGGNAVAASAITGRVTGPREYLTN